MANSEQLAILKKGTYEWNRWRKAYPETSLDFRKANLGERCHLEHAELRGADFREANLRGARLSAAELHGANFSEAILIGADLSNANLERAFLSSAYLSRANLSWANLTEANLCSADLTEAVLIKARLSNATLTRTHLNRVLFLNADLSAVDLCEADLSAADLGEANLTGANLSGADLSRSHLVKTNFQGANLTGCCVYGISAWDVELRGAFQQDLVITPKSRPAIRADNLEVAQFLYLLLNNQNIRRVIDTITSKVVLILGRFTPERKIILDAIRQDLRNRDHLPVVFDFEKPANRDLTETISTLAHMARFVIADITDAKSIPQELMAIVPNLPSVPVQPLLLASQREYGMFEHFRNYPWVLEPVLYQDLESLLAELDAKVIVPAMAKIHDRKGRGVV